MIAAGVKRLENRSWPVPLGLVASGQRLAIHAGRYDKRYETDVRGVLGARGVTFPRECNVYSAIVAVATLAGCYRDDVDLTPADRPWAIAGQWWWILRDVRALRLPIACKGAQGLWIPSPVVEEAVLLQDDTARVAEARA